LYFLIVLCRPVSRIRFQAPAPMLDFCLNPPRRGPAFPSVAFRYFLLVFFSRLLSPDGRRRSDSLGHEASTLISRFFLPAFFLLGPYLVFQWKPVFAMVASFTLPRQSFSSLRPRGFFRDLPLSHPGSLFGSLIIRFFRT